jgi:release factor glutamine methyltransferase
MLSNTIDTLMQSGLDRLDAQMLVLHAMGRPLHDRAWLLLHGEAPVPEQAQRWLDQALQRRLAGEPVAYLTGHKEFYGLDLRVDARVLVPRPDTETLVDWALEVLAPQPGARVVDLGTGSGAIALALKHSRPTLQVHAVDYSSDALAVGPRQCSAPEPAGYLSPRFMALRHHRATGRNHLQPALHLRRRQSFAGPAP